VVGFSVLLVVGVVVAAVALKPDRPRHRSSAAPSPTPTPSSAPISWVADLAPRISLSTPVLLEDEVLYPGAGKPVTGIEGVVQDATPFHGGLLVTWSLPEGDARLSFLTDRGKLEDFGGGQTSFGHAVDASGTRVAFGSYPDHEVQVVRAGNAKVLKATTAANDKARQPGTPEGWWGDQVLLSTGDGAGAGSALWDTTTGDVTPLGTGTYTIAEAVLGDTAVLHQGDGPCTSVVTLPALRQLWQTCDRFVAASPVRDRVLVEVTRSGGGSSYQVRDAATGRTTATLALPPDGVVATGWGSEDAVVAVVRFVADGAESWVVASCPTNGARCHRVHEHSLGSPNGPAARQAFVVTARP
jgi:hypothetical protein